MGQVTMSSVQHAWPIPRQHVNINVSTQAQRRRQWMPTCPCQLTMTTPAPTLRLYDDATCPCPCMTMATATTTMTMAGQRPWRDHEDSEDDDDNEAGTMKTMMRPCLWQMLWRDKDEDGSTSMPVRQRQHNVHGQCHDATSSWRLCTSMVKMATMTSDNVATTTTG